jgi:5-methyltetrahydrofolate--homocysteine methyltransferase
VSSPPPALPSPLDAGRPLLLGSDPRASLRARGARLDEDAAIGRLLREDPDQVAAYYSSEIEAGVDVLLALTSETMPRALAEIGMAFRSAALTRCAVDLGIEAVGSLAMISAKPVAIAGVLGNAWVESMIADRIAEECAMHAARLAASGCTIIVARGFAKLSSSPVNLARLARVTSVVSARATHLPTWALVELDEPERTPDGEALEDCIGAAEDSGAELHLFEVPSAEVGRGVLKRVGALARGTKVGFLLAGSGGRGDETADTISIDAWAKAAKSLADEGARVIGGGPGTTSRHVAALASALRGADEEQSSP